ncbi:MAG: SdpI family protein [Bacilli bacterium]
MLKIVWNFGTAATLFFFTISLIVAIVFLFIKPNEWFGLRVKESLISPEIWHKVHVTSSICTIPFSLGFIAIMFIENSILKETIAFLVFLNLLIVYYAIPKLVTRKDVKMLNQKNANKLIDEIKKEKEERSKKIKTKEENNESNKQTKK